MTTIDNANPESTINPSTTAPPLYDKAPVSLEFDSEAKFQEWLTNVGNKQGIWYLQSNYYKVNEEREELLAEGKFLKYAQTYCCDRYGAPRKSKATADESKRRKRGPSKKVSCKAHFRKKIFTNGQVQVLYHWQHVNHDAAHDIAVKNEKLKNKKEDLRQKVLDEFKDFQENVYVKLEEYKSNPQKLQELKDILKKGFDDLNKCMNSK